MDSSEAYQKVKQAVAVCKESKSKLEAEERLKVLGLWYDFVPLLKYYMDLP